jgi:ketosteroid isomerase-like protein
MSGRPSIETDPVMEGRHRLTDAVVSGDVETIGSLYCEDAVLMAPNEPTLYGRTEVKEFWQEYFEHFRVVSLTETEREVKIIDGWAVERTAYTVVIVPIKGGPRIRDDSRRFVLWKREPDGVWRISESMFNSIRPIGSGTSRFLSRMMERKKKA